jgi:6-phosphogluconolactonase
MKNGIILSAFVFTLGFVQTDAAEIAASNKASAQAVFVMNNSAAKNQILSYSRQKDGTLKYYNAFETGGRGSGGTTDPLGSQGSLILTQDHSILLAVNAGSGQISTFLVNGPFLRLIDVESTGGSAPVSVAQWGDLVYVLNFAGNSNVVGFRLDDGYLRRIHDGVRYLTSDNSGASSLAFSPDGHWLVVTEKLNNNIDVFPVLPNGTLGPVVVTKDPAAGLFDVAFTPEGTLLPLEAGAGTLSSFWVESNGTLTSLSTAKPTLGQASCWLVVTPDGRYVYTSNAGSANISGFSIIGSGILTPIGSTIVGVNPTGSTNLDLAISGDGKFLYTLNSGSGTIGEFAVNNNGTLKSLGAAGQFPPTSGVNGIAAL